MLRQSVHTLGLGLVRNEGAWEDNETIQSHFFTKMPIRKLFISVQIGVDKHRRVESLDDTISQ